MDNPFLDGSAGTDEELVAQAQRGDRDAIEQLVIRHQPWVLNIAVRMLGRRADAEDATQDILLRVLRCLSTFRGESKFRTWLYRIAVNHLLNLKKDAVCSFERAAQGLQQVPDFDPSDPRTVPVPIELLVEEARVGCIMGTLLCLDGRQRLVFILGEVFGISDDVGAEVAGVTPVNFRQILSRAKKDLCEYLIGNCSLANPSATCKCVRKTRAYIQGGFVDPQKLQFTADYQRRVRDVVDEQGQHWTDACTTLYREHPFYEPAGLLRRVLSQAQVEIV